MTDKSDVISSFSKRSIEERALWNSSVALIYNKVRPVYPIGLVAHVAHLTQISSFSRLLEIGCGPGTATLTFAGLECTIICIEPNPDFCELAKRNCQTLQNVRVCQSSFEDWPLERSSFDVVFSASAFHWIQPEVGYPKVAEALRDGGYFVLLWNNVPQPTDDTQPLLSEIYHQHGLSVLVQFESESSHHQFLSALVKSAIDCGLFKEVASKQISVDVCYSAEDYILLLSCFSPYLSMDASLRTSLFEALYKKINDDLMGTINLSYVSAACIFQKVSP